MIGSGFAFIIDPSEMMRLGFLPIWGVLRERSDGREIAYFESSQEVVRFVGDLPLLPSRDGRRGPLLSFGEEMLVISEILDIAPRPQVVPETSETPASASSQEMLDDVEFWLPSGFSRIRNVARDGITLIPQPDGFDVEIDQVVANAIGWRPGDTIAFGLDSSGSRLAIMRVLEGSVLTLSESGNLETFSTVPFPSWVAGNMTKDVVSPPFEIHDEALVMQVSALEAPSPKKGKWAKIVDRFFLGLALLVFAVFLIRNI